jgi:hypothetical protein
MRSILLLLGFSLLLPFLGCASTDDGGDLSNLPEWVRKPGGVYEDDAGVTALYAVGSADKSPSMSAQRTWAKASAVDELGATLSTRVQRMITTYMREAVDRYNMDETASLIQNNEAVSRQLSDAVVLGAQQIDACLDRESGVYYVLVRMPLDNEFLQTYKSKAQAVMREQFAKYSKEIKDQALADLDQAVDTSMQQMQSEASPYQNP